MNNGRNLDRNVYKNYNDSTSAYDLGEIRRKKPKDINYEIEENLKKRRLLREYENKRKLAKRRQMQKIIKANKINFMNKTCFIILSLYIAGSLIFTLKQFDNNNMIKTQIVKSQSIIKEQEKEISEAKMAIADSIDIDEVEKIAMEKYGMKEPSSDQIVYISLPQNVSYIEYEDEIDNSDYDYKNKYADNTINDIQKEVEINNNAKSSDEDLDTSETQEDLTDDKSDESIDN